LHKLHKLGRVRAILILPLEQVGNGSLRVRRRGMPLQTTVRFLVLLFHGIAPFTEKGGAGVAPPGSTRVTS
jgi:hypothetical protein